jgi:hypothetical protein
MAEEDELNEYTKKFVKEIVKEDDEFLGEIGDQLPLDWRGEEWLVFAMADRQIAAELEMSRGVAKRTLRELCAKGDIRSMLARHSDPYEHPVSIQPIKPSEWVNHELDHELSDWLNHVMVSVDDLEYWLGKQPNRKPQEKFEWRTIDINSLPTELRDQFEALTEAAGPWRLDAAGHSPDDGADRAEAAKPPGH